MIMNRILVRAGVLLGAVGVSLGAVILTTSVSSAAGVMSGDLIRGESFSAVYYMGADGFRYVFPNDKAYFTWYSDFDDVIVITDAELAKIQIGGNITYKPGVKMVKINTDPKTYAVDLNGTLRHVTSEAVAVALYGSSWNKEIDDVADGFFPNYTIGEPIMSSSEYNSVTVEASVSTINADKELMGSVDVYINSTGYSPSTVTVNPNQGVRFTNNDTAKHSATGEDLSWGTGTLQEGDAFIKKFEDGGEYDFYDSYDSGNTGTVTVN